MSTKKITPKYNTTGDDLTKQPMKLPPPDLIKKSNTEKMVEYPKEKTPKPEELKNFDAVTHFKENIIHFYKNCPEPIKHYSFL